MNIKSVVTTGIFTGAFSLGGLAQPVAPVAQFACGKATLRGVDQMDCGEPTGAGQHQRITKFYR
jgi:hypothetical protein